MAAFFRTWRLLPPGGFVECQTHGQTWWIKVGWESDIQKTLERAPVGSPLQLNGGRGSVQRVLLGERGAVIVRSYRRGGLMRHLTRDLYWDRPLRPLAELLCTEAARQRGIPTVEVLGAGVEWVRCGSYRGVFITREAEGCINLWAWLRTKPSASARERVAVCVARSLAQLHRAGIAHADLNLTNILVRPVPEPLQVRLIDFDRARLFPGSLSPQRRVQNLRRLCRSLHKLDPEGQFVSLRDLEIFRQAYYQEAGVLR